MKTIAQNQIGEGVSTALLLALMLLSVAGSIAAADWTDGLGVLGWTTLAGMIVGGVLAKTRGRGWLAHLAMLILTIPITALCVSALLPGALTFEEKMIVLSERVIVWMRQVFTGGTSADALIFVIQLAGAMWLIAYSAAWFVYRRHQVWGAILPPGIAITINLFYAAPQTGLYFGLFLTSALLLIVRLNLIAMEQTWREHSIGYSSDISFDFLTYGIAFSLLLIFIVWLVPATAPGPAWLAMFDPFQEPWQAVEDQFNRVFGALRAVGRPSPGAFFGSTLNLGGPVQLGNRLVMDVQTTYGRYWRASVYDKYTGIGWINTRLDSRAIPANDPWLDWDRGAMRVEVTQTFKIHLPDQNTVFAAAQPFRFSLPVEIRFATASPDLDLALARARRPLRVGETYTAVSWISVADEDALRADSIQYSTWISATYLQLPDGLPARVRTLAQTITAKEKNSYDKAAALESYLRTKIKYNEAVSEPPVGRDGVDYTLFDRPEGYCNYYASALAVLARAVGIPARVASGYARGEYSDGAFHVIESSAHAWTEIYFPTYGWIEFEPTANQPAIDRPKKNAGADQPESDPNFESRRRNRNELEDQDLGTGTGGNNAARFWLQIDPRDLALITAGSVLILALGAGTFVLVRRNRRRAPRAPAARVYEAMLTRARWIDLRDQKYATPLERARVIGDALPDARDVAGQIADAYTRERYAAHTLDAAERAALQIAWNHFRAEWRRGFIARVIARATAPIHAIRARIERFRTHRTFGG